MPRSAVTGLAMILSAISYCTAAAQSDSTGSGPSTELLPILSYDSDAGFGYGAKAFALNHLALDESFDLVAFNSTKGEQWYRFVFSIPDFERRQRTNYPLALDVTFDYDKWIKSSFFGVGSASRYADREYYTKEPFTLSIALSRTLASRFIGLLRLGYSTVSDYNADTAGVALPVRSALIASTVRYASFGLSLRYDTRNSFIDPSDGLILQGDAEIAGGTASFGTIDVRIQHYSCPVFPNAVLALRVGAQGLLGENLPLQVLLPAGGGGTLRGFPQDRFLDRAVVIGNAEFRFPIIWRFGGVAGIDAGRVWRSAAELDLHRWGVNGVAGLRFHMDTFIVRLDVGMSNETTGFFLNFGQLF